MLITSCHPNDATMKTWCMPSSSWSSTSDNVICNAKENDGRGKHSAQQRKLHGARRPGNTAVLQALVTLRNLHWNCSENNNSRFDQTHHHVLSDASSPPIRPGAMPRRGRLPGAMPRLRCPPGCTNSISSCCRGRACRRRQRPRSHFRPNHPNDAVKNSSVFLSPKKSG